MCSTTNNLGVLSTTTLTTMCSYLGWDKCYFSVNELISKEFLLSKTYSFISAFWQIIYWQSRTNGRDNFKWYYCNAQSKYFVAIVFVTLGIYLLHLLNTMCIQKYSCTYHCIIEGFGGKRALGILRKIELCQKRFKFRMQFCLGVLNNVLHVFFPETCFLFEILRMRKNTLFRGHPLGTFCWMKNKRNLLSR